MALWPACQRQQACNSGHECEVLLADCLLLLSSELATEELLSPV